MEIKSIRALAEIMKANGLTLLEMSEEGKTLRLERKAEDSFAPVSNVAAAPAVSPAPAPAAEAAPAPETAAEEGVLVESPMVGMYYASPAPGADPFVTVGSRVKKGDVLCIIEAMKTMNEITAEQDGEIVQIYAGNGQLVEVGQRLFRVREIG